METTIMGYIGIILELYWGYIGIIEKKMETTILYYPPSDFSRFSLPTAALPPAWSRFNLRSDSACPRRNN